MKIIAVIITYNRLELLSRALASVKHQVRKPDFVYVFSNSTGAIYLKEEKICKELGYPLYKNHRTNNYAGALNASIEEIVKQFGVKDDFYFASLDDDDLWLPNYLNEMVSANSGDFDLLAANYKRLSIEENLVMTLPAKLSEKDFLLGNPGIGGSNTFLKVKTILKAGCFDETLHSTVDRDFFVRVFQQKPSYKIINKHLITAHTDTNRERLTTNQNTKLQSLQVFYYKYRHLLDDNEKLKFFKRAKDYFSIERSQIDFPQKEFSPIIKAELQFKQKGDYQFIIGYIAGNDIISNRIAKEIAQKSIPVDLVLIIDDVAKGKNLDATRKTLLENSIKFSIVSDNEWRNNLKRGYYGNYYQQFSEINSIPLGRTILHHHLSTETKEYDRPVFWIIDDDISFRAIISPTSVIKNLDVFKIINQNINKTEALIGGISNDSPVPLLSCIRTQLIDFQYSTFSKGVDKLDALNLREKPDYYYDLSDQHTDHLETPIYHQSISEKDLMLIFSGKSLSRPALQKTSEAINKTITRRGANTLIFNRELLQYYPVINLQVDKKHARRGDLIWAILNQVVSDRIVYEHSFSVEHNRPITSFNLTKELDKAAYDIIGYAFSKALLKSIEQIKSERKPHRPKDIFEILNQVHFRNEFIQNYLQYTKFRKARFLMNFYRITGLTMLLMENYQAAKEIYNQLSDEGKLLDFEKTIQKGTEESTITDFFDELTKAIWGYSRSITENSEKDEVYAASITQHFQLEGKLTRLGSGAEGVVFTDNHFVYKCFFNILDKEWEFLKAKAKAFKNNEVLEPIEPFETKSTRFIRYAFHPFHSVKKISPSQLVSFFKFSKEHNFVYTNIKPDNFIQTKSGLVKLIDYGKSFEPFTKEKYINSIKRAYLLWRNPKMKTSLFQKFCSDINRGIEPTEIIGWQNLLNAVEPRKKEEILDSEILSIVKSYQPKKILDYGSGKCKTTRLISDNTSCEVFVFDINREVLKSRCSDFKEFAPNQPEFDQTFDLILLNLVLCEVDDETLSTILSNAYRAIKPNGKLIVSICNPDYCDITQTEFQNRDAIPKDKKNKEVLLKTCRYTGNLKVEYHRPTELYNKVFKQNKFTLTKAIDTEGTDLLTLKKASDFKIFILHK
tara:strand:- start:6311 stop:9691 length:3381 start_codon:yes stop_codon:yes gene_type:complete